MLTILDGTIEFLALIQDQELTGIRVA